MVGGCLQGEPFCNWTGPWHPAQMLIVAWHLSSGWVLAKTSYPGGQTAGAAEQEVALANLLPARKPPHNRGTWQLLLRLSSPGHQPRAKTTLLIHALHGPSVSSDAEDGLQCSKHPGRKTSPQPVPSRAGGSSSCRCSPRPQAACPSDLRASPSPS